MTTVVAHFTAAELPGTTAILLSGIAIGLTARTHLDLLRGVALAVVLTLGLIAATADHFAWAANIAGVLPSNGWDWLWLAAAAATTALAAAPLRQH